MKAAVRTITRKQKYEIESKRVVDGGGALANRSPFGSVSRRGVSRDGVWRGFNTRFTGRGGLRYTEFLRVVR